MFIDSESVGQLKDDVTFADTKENYELKAGFPQQTILDIPTSETVKLTCSLLETNLETIQQLMPEFKALAESSGTETITDEAVVITSTANALLAHQQISAVTVKSSGGTSLTEGTDYSIDLINGTIARKSSSTKIADGDTVKVSYTYTTYTKSGFGIGGGTPTDKTFKVDFYHKRRDGNYRHICIWKGKVTGDFTLAFKETAESPLAVEVTAQADSSKDSGAQYMTVMDEPAASVPGGGW